MDVRTGYETCRRITRRHARNFSYGIRLLPPAKRDAMCAVYALAREVDDIGDGALPPEEKLARLDDVRTRVRTIGAGGGDDPVLLALGDAVRRFPIPLEAFLELVDGVEMDVRGRTYDTFDDLVDYCRHVAGTIGRLSLGVYGADDPVRAAPLADTLGVALQLTNVLRDVREDAAAGRRYLPAEDLARFDVHTAVGTTLPGPPERLVELVRFEAERAQDWYARGLRLLDHLDRRSAACTGAMAGIYARVLDRIARRPQEVLTGRLSLPAWEKAAVAVRSLAGASPRRSPSPIAGRSAP